MIGTKPFVGQIRFPKWRETVLKAEALGWLPAF